MEKQGNITVLFDGYCFLCSGFARWLKRNSGSKMQFLAMQSNKGKNILQHYGFADEWMKEVVVETPRKEIITGSAGILFLISQTGRIGRFVARFVSLFPESWIRAGYRVVAENRYQWFGKRESCAIIQD